MEEYQMEMKPMVGYAYVVDQMLGEIYTVDEGFVAGTMFPELNISAGDYVPNKIGGNIA